MAQQADLKATHYIHQLQNALTRGLWADPSPAQGVKGEPMTWDELLRKYKKHCVSQHITAELALQTQSLSLLLLPDQIDAKRITQEDLDGDSEEPHGSMSLGTECELSPSRVDDARLGFAALELLNDTPNERDSTLFTRAYFAYALKRYKECLALLNPMSFDENLPEPEPEPAPKPARLQVPSDASTSSSTGTHLTWTGSIASVDVDVRDAKMWRLVEIVRGRCLQGMAMEKLDQTEDALGVYEATLPILQTLRLPHTSTSQNGTLDPSFVKYRELWRWAERLLWRASCLVSRFAPIDRALTVFRVYSNHAQYYPPAFRPNHRSVVVSLYLHALLQTYPGSEQAIPGQTRLSWITEARTLIEEYRLVLAKCTIFPKAGDRNIKVEEYCDGVMAVWERTGSNGKDSHWAIEILWWASRMTFHSHRIFRHLVRLIHANGDNELVKRTMALYAQLVTKSRQASTNEVESTIRRRRTLDLELDNDVAVMGDIESVEDSIGSDSDRQFVECLIFGARMLCRLPGDVEDIKAANSYLISARSVVSQSTSLGRDNILRARLSCAEGVVELTLAHRDADPITRPQLMRSALNHLGSAVQLNSASSDAYYHLAIALIQAGPTRDVEASVQAAQHAVELDASDIRYWHLLGLVLSASGQHAQARKVLIIGEELELDGDMEGPDETAAPTTSESVLDEKRSDSPKQLNTLIPAHHKLCPTPSKMLLPVPDHPQPSKEDIFEHGLQLRMTLLSIIELVEGAEVASVKWVEVFAWFAERGGWAQPHDERRASFDLPPIHTIPPSESGHETGEDEFYPRLIRSASASDLPTDGMPITIVPPPPKEQGDSDSVHTVRLSSEKDEEHSISRTKKAQRIIKEHVNKRQSQIQTISKKLGRSNTLRSQMSRASSTPDITLLAENSRLYQASSIHSRQRMSPRASYINTPQSPPMPRTPPAPALADIFEQRTKRERRLICELWLTCAATFRRMGKLEQAREAIQEAEGLDEAHPGVWVQLGLYFVANGEASRAISAFHKALVINPDFIPAVVHLAQQYLKPGAGKTTSASASEEAESERGTVDLAAGMLSSFTKGPGWDVPEAWYLLGNAVSLQGRKERERECLTYALGLVEGKPIRDIRIALDCAL